MALTYNDIAEMLSGNEYGEEVDKNIRKLAKEEKSTKELEDEEE